MTKQKRTILTIAVPIGVILIFLLGYYLIGNSRDSLFEYADCLKEARIETINLEEKFIIVEQLACPNLSKSRLNKSIKVLVDHETLLEKIIKEIDQESGIENESVLRTILEDFKVGQVVNIEISKNIIENSDIKAESVRFYEDSRKEITF